MKYICFILQLFSDLFTHKIEILDEMFSSRWSTKHFILVQALSIFAMSFFVVIILTALSIDNDFFALMLFSQTNRLNNCMQISTVSLSSLIPAIKVNLFFSVSFEFLEGKHGGNQQRVVDKGCRGL